jgi:N-acetylneuraminate synthase/N,N'-diacetyllegionaminate synthase
MTDPNRVFVVCEAGVTNYGELELALRQVDAAADARADAVKFQIWDTAELVSRSAAADASSELGYDWYERMEERRLSHDDLRAVREHAVERGIAFFASPHDEPSLRFLVDELDVPMIKVGSGEAANERFLRAVGATGRRVLIAFGLQSDAEAKRAVDVLREAGAEDVVALHTVTLYPTPPELASLPRIERLATLLGSPVGISDHTVGRHVVLAAVARGARVVEKHLTFDKADPRSLDNPGALEPDEFTALVREIRELEAALRSPDAEVLEHALASSRAWAEQAVVASRRLPVGTTLGEADLAFKRPAHGGIPASEAGGVIGRRLRREVDRDEQIREDDLD